MLAEQLWEQQDVLLSGTSCSLTPFLQHGVAAFISAGHQLGRGCASWSCPRTLLLGCPRPERVRALLHGAAQPCLLPALQSGAAAGLQDAEPAGEIDGDAGRKQKNNKTSTPLQNKQTKNPLKTPELIFILERAASRSQAQEAGGLSCVTPRCASLPAQQSAESQGNPRAIYSRVEMNPVFVSLCLLQRSVFFPGKHFRNPEGSGEAERAVFWVERLGRGWLSLGRAHVDAGLGSASPCITTAFFSPSLIPCLLPPRGNSLWVWQAGEQIW